jgi:hypothetical protein
LGCEAACHRACAESSQGSGLAIDIATSSLLLSDDRMNGDGPGATALGNSALGLPSNDGGYDSGPPI